MINIAIPANKRIIEIIVIHNFEKLRQQDIQFK